MTDKVEGQTVVDTLENREITHTALMTSIRALAATVGKTSRTLIQLWRLV